MKERAPTTRALTPREQQVVELVSADLSTGAIAEHMQLSRFSVINLIARAGAKIPGDLPLRQRIRHWYRGGAPFREAS